jgi:hypothetical protein
MARRCFQEGCVFKRGRRKKVWVGRWSEYVVDESGGVRRVLKSEVLGPVSELSKGDAKERLRERLRRTATAGRAVRQTLRSRFSSRRGGSRRYFRRTRTQRDSNIGWR